MATPTYRSINMAATFLGIDRRLGIVILILAFLVFLAIRRLATTKMDVLVEDVDLEADSDDDRIGRGRALGLDLG